jgi:urease accessory protein
MHSHALLHLLQISDTAFPTGSFSHSMGLEAFAEAGELESAEDLTKVVGLYLRSLATSDCVALRAAYGENSLDELFYVDLLLTATKLTRELRMASSATGKRFLVSLSAFGVEDAVLDEFTAAVKAGTSPGNLAVGYGVAAPALGLYLEDVLLAYLYASAASLVAAGQKLIPLGGSAAQRVLFDLWQEIARAAEKSKVVAAQDMYAFSPTIDLHSMLHERQRVRLYIS